MKSDLNQLKIIFVVIHHTNGIKVYFDYGVIKFFMSDFYDVIIFH